MRATDKDREVSRNCRNAWDRNADSAADIIAEYRDQSTRTLIDALLEARHVIEDYALDYDRPVKSVREIFTKDLLAMIDNAINLAAGKDIED